MTFYSKMNFLSASLKGVGHIDFKLVLIKKKKKLYVKFYEKFFICFTALTFHTDEALLHTTLVKMFQLFFLFFFFFRMVLSKLLTGRKIFSNCHK